MKSKKYAEVNGERCVACGECQYVCPRDAIKVKNGCFAVVDRELCVGCGLCGRHCPAGCIAAKERGV